MCKAHTRARTHTHTGTLYPLTRQPPSSTFPSLTPSRPQMQSTPICKQLAKAKICNLFIAIVAVVVVVVAAFVCCYFCKLNFRLHCDFGNSLTFWLAAGGAAWQSQSQLQNANRQPEIDKVTSQGGVGGVEWEHHSDNKHKKA